MKRTVGCDEYAHLFGCKRGMNRMKGEQRANSKKMPLATGYGRLSIVYVLRNVTSIRWWANLEKGGKIVGENRNAALDWERSRESFSFLLG